MRSISKFKSNFLSQLIVSIILTIFVSSIYAVDLNKKPLSNTVPSQIKSPIGVKPTSIKNKFACTPEEASSRIPGNFDLAIDKIRTSWGGGAPKPGMIWVEIDYTYNSKCVTINDSRIKFVKYFNTFPLPPSEDDGKRRPPPPPIQPERLTPTNGLDKTFTKRVSFRVPENIAPGTFWAHFEVSGADKNMANNKSETVRFNQGIKSTDVYSDSVKQQAKPLNSILATKESSTDLSVNSVSSKKPVNSSTLQDFAVADAKAPKRNWDLALTELSYEIKSVRTGEYKITPHATVEGISKFEISESEIGYINVELSLEGVEPKDQAKHKISLGTKVTEEKTEEGKVEYLISSWVFSLLPYSVKAPLKEQELTMTGVIRYAGEDDDNQFTKSIFDNNMNNNQKTITVVLKPEERVTIN